MTMMITEKYRELINAAVSAGVQNLQVTEKDNVLFIEGQVASAGVKEMLWATFDKIDPDFLSADLVMNIVVKDPGKPVRAKIATERTGLNIRKGPGTDQNIIAKASHHEKVTVLDQSNPFWWYVRTDDGEEGFAYAQYLAIED